MLPTLYGEVPTNPVIMAACDSKYFIEHGPAFMYSCSDNDYSVHVHIINPTPQALSLAGILAATSTGAVTYTFEDKDFEGFTWDQERTYYACSRFLVLPEILNSSRSVMVLDIDCMVMRHFMFPETPCGYFPRVPLEGTTGWEAEGTRVAAGVVYMNASALSVANAVADYISKSPLKWFADQIALSRVFAGVSDENITTYDNQFMDWEFIEGTAIWTGKGPRKHDNPVYVAKKNSYPLRIEGVRNVLLKPRLDIPFKKFGLERRNEAPLPEIRTWWEKFAQGAAWGTSFQSEGSIDDDFLIEMPRWTFNDTIEDYFPNADFLVPHVERHNWGGGDNTKFYMQTVFPWLFTIDPQGWGGGASFVEKFDPNDDRAPDAFQNMQQWARSGESKFPQPRGTNFEANFEFIFVPLQLPHDETILYHSDVSCLEFVESLCKWCHADSSRPVAVFKGHPVNLGAMTPLMKIIAQYNNVMYVTDHSINDLIPKASAVYVINSGVGQEAMLHDKPVVSFGRSEYQGAVINAKLDDLNGAWDSVLNIDRKEMKRIYRNWYDWYLYEVVTHIK